MRNHSNTQLPNAPPLTSTKWQTSTSRVLCHALHAQAFYTRLVFPLPLTIRPRQVNSLYSADHHRHYPKTTDLSRYLCVTSTRDSESCIALQTLLRRQLHSNFHSTRAPHTPASSQPNPGIENLNTSFALSMPTNKVHRCKCLLLRHSKGKCMHI